MHHYQAKAPAPPLDYEKFYRSPLPFHAVTAFDRRCSIARRCLRLRRIYFLKLPRPLFGPRGSLLPRAMASFGRSFRRDYFFDGPYRSSSIALADDFRRSGFSLTFTTGLVRKHIFHRKGDVVRRLREAVAAFFADIFAGLIFASFSFRRAYQSAAPEAHWLPSFSGLLLLISSASFYHRRAFII